MPRFFSRTLSPLLLSFALAGSWLGSSTIARADEHYFGWVRGAETLPKGKSDAYQFFTLREGKPQGDYYAFDSNTEIEYGVTDKLQLSFSVDQHYFDIDGVEELEQMRDYRFGGIELTAKYRILSPFKDLVGLAFRVEGGFFSFDDVAGIEQQEFDIAPEFILHKNFFEDTLITHVNFGIKGAWGKKPAEEYDYEGTLQGGVGIAYRFAPRWFFGVEGHWRSEFPEFDKHKHEHTVVFAGPTLHYGSEKWWATLSYGYQVYGTGVDEPENGQSFAEEERNQWRLKLGYNF